MFAKNGHFMHISLRIGLLIVLTLGVVRHGAAQNAATVAPGANSVATEPLTFNQISGFAKSEVITSDGQKHILYVPPNPQGFGELVPFFNAEEDIEKEGAQPLFLSVDKVQAIYVNTTGLYLEHMVVEGKPQHVLGARVLEGAVELFCYTQIGTATTGPPGFQATPVTSSRRLWYLRRKGQLVKVMRSGFAKQMAAYFGDDPVLVVAIAGKRLGYDEMRLLVRLYNEHKAAAGSSK